MSQAVALSAARQSWNLARFQWLTEGRQVLLRRDEHKKNMRNSISHRPSILSSVSFPFYREKVDSTEALMTPFIRFPSEESIPEACWELQGGITAEPMKRSQNSWPQRLQTYFPPEVSVARFIIFFFSLFHFSCKRADEARRRRTGVMNDGKLISQRGG